MPNLLSRIIFLIFLFINAPHFALASTPSWLTQPEPSFLPVDQAFIRHIEIKNQTVIAQWDIADGYYMYQKRFSFSLEANSPFKLGAIKFKSPSTLKHDDNFGDVFIFHRQAIIEIPFTRQQKTNEPMKLTLTYQGCAEAGLCYPPKTVTESLIIPKSVPSIIPRLEQGIQKKIPANYQDANSLVSFLSHSSLFASLGLFFLLGIGLSLTPCVLPMVPILSSLIAGQNKKSLSTKEGFLLSSSYVLGMALTFSLLGLIVGLTGKHITLYLQNPWILSIFACLFIALAFSLFGFYELQLPSFLRNHLDNLSRKQKGGHWLGVFIMGALSALVVSPCVSAPLAGALLYIAQAGDAMTGALSLFSLALGMGAPLLIIGTSSAHLLPKAGAWMNNVKSFFGVLLLGIAAWLLRSVLPGTIMMVIWAGLLIIPALYMGALTTTNNKQGARIFWQGIAIIMLVYGILLVVGAAQGRSDPLHPLVISNNISKINSSTELQFHKITRLTELNKQLQEARQLNKPVMLDFYADWCIACIEMEKGTFADPLIHTALKDFYLIQADITNTPDAEALLNRFGLLGPPSILFFTAQGKLLESVSISGEMKAEAFYLHLQKVRNLLQP